MAFCDESTEIRAADVGRSVVVQCPPPPAHCLGAVVDGFWPATNSNAPPDAVTGTIVTLRLEPTGVALEGIGPADLRWIRVEDLMAQHSSLRDFSLPETPALYWWTRDIEQIILSHNQQPFGFISRPLGRPFSGRAESSLTSKLNWLRGQFRSTRCKRSTTNGAAAAMTTQLNGSQPGQLSFRDPLHRHLAKSSHTY